MKDLNKFIEHTLLKQDAKKEDLVKLLCENGKIFSERYRC